MAAQRMQQGQQSFLTAGVESRAQQTQQQRSVEVELDVDAIVDERLHHGPDLPLETVRSLGV